MDVGALFPIVVPTSVNIQLTTTPLLATKDLSVFDSLLWFFLNDDTGNTWTATIETGETSDALDAEFNPSLIVPVSAGGKAGQRSLLIGPSQLRHFYRASGIATGGIIAARWGLYGLKRSERRG